MTTYVIREFKNEVQLGYAVMIEATNEKGAKRYASRMETTLGSILTLETPEGVLLDTRREGLWSNAAARFQEKVVSREQKQLAKTQKLEAAKIQNSLDTTFVMREFQGERLLQRILIKTSSLYKAKIATARSCLALHSLVYLETENGKVLAKKEEGRWG